MAERLVACAVSEGDQSESASFGIFVHDCIHEYLLACIAANQESHWSTLRQIVVNQFYRTPRGLGPERLDEAQDLLDRFAHTHLAELDTLLYLQGGEPALEYTMKLDVGWAIITGTVDRMDRIDGDDRDDPPRIVRATDYKSQWAQSPHLFQGRTYAQLTFAQPWAASLEEFHWMPDPFKLRSDPREGVIVYRRGDLDEWWVETLAGLRQRWDLRVSGRARPTGGAACTYCALRYSCPSALPVARDIPENVDQAVELVGEWIRFDLSRKLRGESLAAWFNNHAPIQVGGYEVGYLEPRDERFVASDPMGIVNHLNSMGLDGAAALKSIIDQTKIPSVVKPLLVEAKVARMERGKATFRRRKVGAPGDEE